MRNTCIIILLTMFSAVGNSPKSQETPKNVYHQKAKNPVLDSLAVRDDSIAKIRSQIDESYNLSKKNISILQKEISASQKTEKDIDILTEMVKTHNVKVTLTVHQIQPKQNSVPLPAIQYNNTQTHTRKRLFKRN